MKNLFFTLLFSFIIFDTPYAAEDGVSEIAPTTAPVSTSSSEPCDDIETRAQKTYKFYLILDTFSQVINKHLKDNPLMTQGEKPIFLMRAEERLALLLTHMPEARADIKDVMDLAGLETSTEPESLAHAAASHQTAVTRATLKTLKPSAVPQKPRRVEQKIKNETAKLLGSVQEDMKTKIQAFHGRPDGAHTALAVICLYYEELYAALEHFFPSAAAQLQASPEYGWVSITRNLWDSFLGAETWHQDYFMAEIMSPVESGLLQRSIAANNSKEAFAIYFGIGALADTLQHQFRLGILNAFHQFWRKEPEKTWLTLLRPEDALVPKSCLDSLEGLQAQLILFGLKAAEKAKEDKMFDGLALPIKAGVDTAKRQKRYIERGGTMPLDAYSSEYQALLQQIQTQLKEFYNMVQKMNDLLSMPFERRTEGRILALPIQHLCALYNFYVFNKVFKDLEETAKKWERMSNSMQEEPKERMQKNADKLRRELQDFQKQRNAAKKAETSVRKGINAKNELLSSERREGRARARAAETNATGVGGSTDDPEPSSGSGGGAEEG